MIALNMIKVVEICLYFRSYIKTFLLLIFETKGSILKKYVKKSKIKILCWKENSLDYIKFFYK